MKTPPIQLHRVQHLANVQEHFRNKGIFHFIGIGGIGMSAIAELLHRLGCHVQGSDKWLSPNTERLDKLGITIFHKHKKGNLHGCSVVVYSSAIAPTNCERQEATRLEIPTLLRGQVLGELTQYYKAIAISGSHGKTTTTSLISCLLADAKLDPTLVAGGIIKQFQSNVRLGETPYMVAEADESDASLTYLHPFISVITNIDCDHMSTYQFNFQKLKDTFRRFAQSIPTHGKVVLCGEDENLRTLLPKFDHRYLFYGFDEEHHICAKDIRYAMDTTWFTLSGKNIQTPKRLNLRLVGRHNILNALAAITVGLELKVDLHSIMQSLEAFQGTQRRFERYPDLVCNQKTMMVLDDYAHHPKELEATMQAVREALPQRKLIVIFQPHRYSRTRALLGEFVDILAASDALLLLPIYPADETYDPTLDELLYKSIDARASSLCQLVSSLQDIRAALPSVAADNGVVLFMGAGSIGKLPQHLNSPVMYASEQQATLQKSTTIPTSKPSHISPEHAAHTSDSHTLKFGKFENSVTRNCSLAIYNTWRVGGKAEYLFQPQTLKELVEFLCRFGTQKKMFFLGLGSNTLVRDRGIPGITIVMKNLRYIQKMEKNIIRAETGTPCPSLAHFCVKNKLRNLEFLVGIPGTVGGALKMNAGIGTDTIWKYINSIQTVDRNGELHHRTPEDFDIHYRQVQQNYKNEWFATAAFHVEKTSDLQKQHRQIAAFIDARRRTQPKNNRNCGSVFKNPEGGFAAELIERCKLKSHTIGNAKVSQKHANFILGYKGATALDIESLIFHVQHIVKKKTGILLEPEVHFAGN